MSEMMDRAAAAAREVDPTIWVGADQQRYFRKVAIAVFEAIREPTDDMPFPEAVKQYWRAMIDEALK